MLINNLLRKASFILVLIIISIFCSASIFDKYRNENSQNTDNACPLKYENMTNWAKRELKIINRINVHEETHENRIKKILLCFGENANFLQNLDDEAVVNFKTFFIKVEEKNLEDSNYYYLKAKSYQIGIGVIRNYEESYRLALIASSKGSEASRIVIRLLNKKLTNEQIKKATCLAEKGPNPSWIQKQLCKW